MPRKSTIPALKYTPEELLEIGKKKLTVDDMRKVGTLCFRPWVEDFKNGTTRETISQRLRTKGYTKVFDELSKNGLTKGVNSLDGEHHVFHNCIWLPIVEFRERSERLEAGAADRKHLGDTATIDVPRFTETAANLLKSSDPVGIALGVMACTGRRGIEVVVSGIFMQEDSSDGSYLDGVDPAYVYRFKNPAKKHNTDTALEDRPEFPTTSLVMTSDLLKSHKQMRQSSDLKELLGQLKPCKDELQRNNRFNDLWEHKLSRCMADNFSFLPGKLREDGTRKPATPQDLRPAYAEITAWRDLERDDMGQVIKGSDILYKAQILGHYIKGSKKSETLKRLGSTLSYYGYRVSEKPSYPPRLFEDQVVVRCWESDREWLNLLSPEHTQADTIRYLRSKYEALEAENLELRERLRKATEESPEPAKEPVKPIEQTPDVIAMLQRLEARIDGLEHPFTENNVEIVQVTPTPKSKSAPAPKLSSRQVKAFQWLDIVVAHIKDHNLRNDSDIWQMWAFSPRLLKDVSKVSQRLVGEFWAENEAELIALNEQWALDDQHNRKRGMRKDKPTDDFQLERPEELK